MKLLLDEHYPQVIAEQLRRRGFDAVAVVETPFGDPTSLRRMPDDALLRRATAEERVLVTENVRDLVPLHRLLVARGESHSGIILTSWRRYSRERDAVGRLIMALAEFMEKHESVAGTLTWL